MRVCVSKSESVAIDLPKEKKLRSTFQMRNTSRSEKIPNHSTFIHKHKKSLRPCQPVFEKQLDETDNFGS